MAHLGRVTETMTTRTVGLTREQVAAWHDATWTDATTPRTDRPVRFVWLSDRVYPSATPGVPSWRSYKPRVARGYMQSVRPVRFPA